MAMAASDIERLIRASIPDAEVTIRDLAGDGDHYAATVIAELFRGKSRVQQHQIVYSALRGEMGGKLHALALQTGAPERLTSLTAAVFIRRRPADGKIVSKSAGHACGFFRRHAGHRAKFGESETRSRFAAWALHFPCATYM